MRASQACAFCLGTATQGTVFRRLGPGCSSPTSEVQKGHGSKMPVGVSLPADKPFTTNCFPRLSFKSNLVHSSSRWWPALLILPSAIRLEDAFRASGANVPENQPKSERRNTVGDSTIKAVGRLPFELWAKGLQARAAENKKLSLQS